MNLHFASRLPLFLVLIVLVACGEQSAPRQENQVEPQAAPAAPVQPVVEKPRHLGADAWPVANNPLVRDAKVEEKVQELLAQMSLEEKVGQIMQGEIRHVTPDDVRKYHLGSILNGGGSFPGQDKFATQEDWLEMADEFHDASMDTSDGKVAIPLIWGTDAVHGHSNVIGATVFPHNIGLGAMNNPELVREIGSATALEILATGIDWTFAPTVAVTQDDRWGRSYESYSEDPALVKAYAREMVYGLQGVPGTPEFLDSRHVLATAKHYLADGGTEAGDDQGNAKISEEELRDIHAPGYVGAIEAGVQTVMASFSSWNGAKMHGNPYLLTDVLRGQMNFDGFVIGDWNGHGQVPGCTNASCAASFNAGLDMFMVIDEWKDLYHSTLEQVREGEITQERLDEAVRRVLRVKILAGVFEKGRPSERARGLAGVIGNAQHRAVARQAVRESLVLLKNSGDVLPLQPGQKVLVAGDGAENMGKQTGGWTISWQGTGNEKSDFPKGSSILDGLNDAVSGIGGSVEYSEEGDYSSKPDVAVVVFGENPYAEYQGDRPTLDFEPGNKQSLELLKKLSSDGIPVVSVFITGRPLWTSPEINASDAFVIAWLPGSEGGGVADVLVGDSVGNPRHDFSGQLSFSWPRSPLQFQLNPHHEPYDPLFAFGYGLDYASGEEGPGLIAENIEGLEKESGDTFALYTGRPLPPWAVHIKGAAPGTMMVSGPYAAHASGAVIARAADMKVQEDALSVEFSGSETGGIQVSGPGVDLSGYRENGVLSFMYLQDRPADGLVTLSVGEAAIDLGKQVEPLVGTGWAQVVVPVSCFAAEDNDLSKVEIAFFIESEGRAELSFGEILFHKEGEANIGCD